MRDPARSSIGSAPRSNLGTPFRILIFAPFVLAALLFSVGFHTGVLDAGALPPWIVPFAGPICVVVHTIQELPLVGAITKAGDYAGYAFADGLILLGEKAILSQTPTGDGLWR